MLFIPVFNFYWAFIVLGKLPDEAGRYLASLHGGKPPISKGLSITFCILTILAVVPVFGIVAALINQFLFTALMFQWSAFLRVAAQRPAARQAA